MALRPPVPPLIAAALLVVQVSACSSAPSERAVVQGVSSPVTLCLNATAHEVMELQSGQLRVGVVVHAFEMPRPPSGQLFAALLAGTPPTPRELTRFAVHPLRSFGADQPRRQSFLVTLTGYAHLLTPGKPVCLQVGFSPSAASAKGGRAEVSVELVRLPP